MKLEIGQTWVSEINPHENFTIYDGAIDTCADAYKDESIPFNEQPESAKILFWKRTDEKAFEKFIQDNYGEGTSTYPFAWYGASKKAALTTKIKKNHMKLSAGVEE
ncbi:hypothetical protein SLL00_03570 [Metabacillus indicus]|uniref:hypothetical protein n=1 Tax=Metabacillus indicus TaxID=246786 RepID=UPI002A00B0B3|nr:hypothetical protein [Metabacillus indicus]MDX8288853.1 hypothetical protein [Metabacillus indicus]